MMAPWRMIDRAAIIAKIKAAITASAEVNPKDRDTKSPAQEPGHGA